MLAKYDGFCKVTGQKIVAGQTNIENINGRWQIASQAANKNHMAPKGATMVLAWSDVCQDRYGDEYLKHYAAFTDDDWEPIGKIWSCSSARVAWATATMLFEANRDRLTDIIDELYRS